MSETNGAFIMRLATRRPLEPGTRPPGARADCFRRNAHRGQREQLGIFWCGRFRRGKPRAERRPQVGGNPTKGETRNARRDFRE
nr:MAG: hypothetical protein DIU78_15700 [Pseudomonadota bacterium]